MDVLHERCVGLDIGKKDAKVCVRTPSAKRRGSFTDGTTTWGSTTNAVLALLGHLLAAEVTLVVIEATPDYWKPFSYVLADDLNVILVNARQVKNLPGRNDEIDLGSARVARRPDVQGELSRFGPGDGDQGLGSAGALAHWGECRSCPGAPSA
ncbi:hypothetical protein EES39_30955 [Streptomyces sp. ADI92-24]|uniref:IS110 family transposase n=1 Tax=unclassified Streptomyces TaxID=2593676 RepID=UPI000F55386A|nr:transposase [Streptomyces sp. ADI92-24]RPK37292.1 hypothetical protein EES39_30955 [Streptomyces sp. ADI92-24]